jgi:hypothetical protein
VRRLKRIKRKFTDRRDTQRDRSWINVDVAHSGDEHSVSGSKDYQEESSREDDSHFTGDFAPMPVWPLHDQAAVFL